MTRLLTIPKFALETGLSYRLCLQLVQQGKIPSVQVNSRRRIDIRWVDQWLQAGGYRCPTTEKSTESSSPGDPGPRAK
jgi:excisionase family DNA binding protein